MTVVTVGIIGIMTVLMAVQLKSLKGEYGLYLVLAAACVIFFYGTLRLKGILEGLQKIQDLIRINPVYLNTLLKMTGITYIVEFASGICRDAGYAALGTQIEILESFLFWQSVFRLFWHCWIRCRDFWHEAGEKMAGLVCCRLFFILYILPVLARRQSMGHGYSCGGVCTFRGRAFRHWGY